MATGTNETTPLTMAIDIQCDCATAIASQDKIIFLPEMWLKVELSPLAALSVAGMIKLST